MACDGRFFGLGYKGIEMFLLLHRLDGTRVWVNFRSVQTFGPDYNDPATRIAFQDGSVTVKETAEEIECHLGYSSDPTMICSKTEQWWRYCRGPQFGGAPVTQDAQTASMHER